MSNILGCVIGELDLTSPQTLFMGETIKLNPSMEVNVNDGKFFKDSSLVDEMFEAKEILIYEKLVAASRGAQWIGWSSQSATNLYVAISAWLKYLNTVPTKRGNLKLFDENLAIVLFDDCQPNKWCFVKFKSTKPLVDDRNEYRMILMFDYVNEIQTIWISQLKLEFYNTTCIA